MPIDDTPPREPPLLGDAPVAMLFAVFDTPMAFQVHTPESVASSSAADQHQGLYHADFAIHRPNRSNFKHLRSR